MCHVRIPAHPASSLRPTLPPTHRKSGSSILTTTSAPLLSCGGLNWPLHTYSSSTVYAMKVWLEWREEARGCTWGWGKGWGVGQGGAHYTCLYMCRVSTHYPTIHPPLPTHSLFHRPPPYIHRSPHPITNTHTHSHSLTHN